MNVGTQAKLLRILEGHPVRARRRQHADPGRCAGGGGDQPAVGESDAASGTFRRDLFFRLQVVEIRVPPLRERKSDVPMLAEHFLKRFVRETGRKIRGFTPAALQKMEEYHWPGNVRELRNVVERAVALGTGPMLDVGDIWLSSLETPAAAPSGERRGRRISRCRWRRSRSSTSCETLEHTDWNKSQAASDPEHRALDAGSQDQGVWAEAVGGRPPCLTPSASSPPPPAPAGSSRCRGRRAVRRRQPLLGELQRPRRLLQRQHRLRRAAAVLQLVRRPLDQPLEHIGRRVGLAAPDVDLTAAQLVVVAAPALVLLAVHVLALVDVIQRRVQPARFRACCVRNAYHGYLSVRSGRGGRAVRPSTNAAARSSASKLWAAWNAFSSRPSVSDSPSARPVRRR